MKTVRLVTVAGARPQFIKLAAVSRAFSAWNESGSDVRFEERVVHTGQHYDDNMSKVFFEDLRMPEPDIYLGIGSGSHAEQTARVMVEFEKVCAEEKPDLVVVVGDVNSTLACSVVSSKLCVPVAHVEAGLRSFDRGMPEEINRMVTDRLSEILLTPSSDGDANLQAEGVPEHAVSRRQFLQPKRAVAIRGRLPIRKQSPADRSR